MEHSIKLFLVLISLKFSLAILLKDFYSFGSTTSDFTLPNTDDVAAEVTLGSNFSFFGNNLSIFHVSFFLVVLLCA